MPRHLISDAHEWINEIPTVPICLLVACEFAPALCEFFGVFGVFGACTPVAFGV